MKKAIVFIVVMAFMASIANVALGRTIEEEKLAVQDFLKVIDAKIIKARNAGQFAKTTKLKADKAGTLARWNKLKASLAPVAIAVAPAPVVAPVPPPVPVPAPTVAAPYTPWSIFGLGLNTELKGQYINTGLGVAKGSVGVVGNIMLDLGPTFGISGNAIKFKLGTGYFFGGGGLKAIPVYAGGLVRLPQWLGGQDAYLTGGLNYVVYGNGRTSGQIGGDAAFGVTADFGLGLGPTGFEIGYSVVRSNTVTSKGISLAVSQPIYL